MTMIASKIGVDNVLCGRCGGCVPVCAANAIYLASLSLEIDDLLCTACGDCVIACPVGALKLDHDG
jgi:MinD superfamily P-loop ATPase